VKSEVSGLKTEAPVYGVRSPAYPTDLLAFLPSYGHAPVRGLGRGQYFVAGGEGAAIIRLRVSLGVQARMDSDTPKYGALPRLPSRKER
jgi:hypothetical protein